VRSVPHLAPPRREGDCPRHRPNTKRAAGASSMQPDGGHAPCAFSSSWVPCDGGGGKRAKQRVHLNKLGKRWNGVQRCDRVQPHSKTACIQSMAPSFQGTIQATLTQAPHNAVQLKAETILPQGSMASNTPAESGEGSSAKGRLRHPGPTLTSGRL
jgi:hypothetical protein